MNILLSIHPEHARKIYAGEKTIEFRTTMPRKYELCKDIIFLYETAPVFAVTGWIKLDSYINVSKIFNGKRDELKRDIIKNGCLTFHLFEQIKAYEPSSRLWGWHIKECFNWGPIEYITRFSPSEKPPQSWCYTKAEVHQTYLKFDHQLNEKSYEKEKEILNKWEKNKGGDKCRL